MVPLTVEDLCILHVRFVQFAVPVIALRQLENLTCGYARYTGDRDPMMNESPWNLPWSLMFSCGHRLDDQLTTSQPRYNCRFLRVGEPVDPEEVPRIVAWHRPVQRPF